MKEMEGKVEGEVKIDGVDREGGREEGEGGGGQRTLPE